MGRKVPLCTGWVPCVKGVDILHGEVNPSFMGNGQNMENRVGGTAHGDIQGHGIHKRMLWWQWSGAVPRRHPLRIPGLAHLNNALCCLLEQGQPARMGGHHRTVSGKSQAQGLVQTVHGVGGKHAGTGAAGGAGRPLNLGDLLISDRVVHRPTTMASTRS